MKNFILKLSLFQEPKFIKVNSSDRLAVVVVEQNLKKIIMLTFCRTNSSIWLLSINYLE